MRKVQIELLLTSAWSTNDIAMYYNISNPAASEIKQKVENRYGCIEADKGKARTRVSSDKVIAMMGGTSTQEELQKIETFFSIKEKEFKLRFEYE